MRSTMEKPFCTPLDALRVAIATALLAPSLPALAANSVTADGVGGPTIELHQDVPVVHIVAPDAQGLSHNRFTEFSVGAQGLVLNNSVAAGTSELAGALQANPHFTGTAATTILNEVTGLDSSNINGPQAIFGSPADYVLVNPNGITLDGASMDNALRATFAAGSVELQDGQPGAFDTRHAKGLLHVEKGGASNRAGGLTLIAPSINSTGELRSGGDLELIMGGNLIDASSHRIVEAAGMPQRIDANLLGAMAADQRINIVSSNVGTGIKMPGTQLTAGTGISIQSAGDINLHAPSRGGKPGVSARIDAGVGDLHLISASQLNLSSAQLSATGQTQLAANAVRSKGAGVASEGALRIVADSVVNANATHLQGREVFIDVTGKITDTGTHYVSTQGKVQVNADNHDMKAYITQTAEGAAVVSSARVGEVKAADGIEINLAGNGRYEGTRFAAAQGPITVKSGGNLTVGQANTLVERMGKAGSSLERMAVVASFAGPGDIDLQALRDLQLNGVDVGTADGKAGSFSASAGGVLTSLAATGKRTSAGSGESNIAGGAYHLGQTDESAQTQVGNQWHVHGDLNLQAGARKPTAIRLQGVQADAAGIRLNAKAGGIHIEGASSSTRLDSKQLSADFSDPAKPVAALTYRHDQAQTHRDARLAAATVTLDSALDVRLDGVRVETDTLAGAVTGKLTASSRGDHLQSLKVDGTAALGEGADPRSMLKEMSALAGQWHTPGKDALAALPAASDTSLARTHFELSRADQRGVIQVNPLTGHEATTLAVAGGIAVAADDQSSSHVQTTHRLTTEKSGLKDAKRLYEQVRIR